MNVLEVSCSITYASGECAYYWNLCYKSNKENEIAIHLWMKILGITVEFLTYEYSWRFMHLHVSLASVTEALCHVFSERWISNLWMCLRIHAPSLLPLASATGALHHAFSKANSMPIAPTSSLDLFCVDSSVKGGVEEACVMGARGGVGSGDLISEGESQHH